MLPLLRTITTHQLFGREISPPDNKPLFFYPSYMALHYRRLSSDHYPQVRKNTEADKVDSDFNTKTLRHKHSSESMHKVKNLRCYLHGTLVGSVSKMWDLKSQQGAKVRGQMPKLPNICNSTLLSLRVVNVQTKNNCPTLVPVYRTKQTKMVGHPFSASGLCAGSKLKVCVNQKAKNGVSPKLIIFVNRAYAAHLRMYVQGSTWYVPFIFPL